MGQDGGGGGGGNGGGGGDGGGRGIGSSRGFGGSESNEGGAIITGNGRRSEHGPLAGAATRPRGPGTTTAPAATASAVSANRATATATVTASGDDLGGVTLSAGAVARALHAAWRVVRDGRSRGDSASVGVRLAGWNASSPGAEEGKAQLEGRGGKPSGASRASRVVRQRGVRREDHAAVSTALVSRGERSKAADSSPPRHGVGSGIGMAASKGELPRMPAAAPSSKLCHEGGCAGAEEPSGSERGLRVQQLLPGT